MFTIKSRYYQFLLLVLLLLGGWQLGQAGYMVAKAELAQMLLDSAWRKTRIVAQKSAEVPRFKPWPWADTWPIAKLFWPQLDTELTLLSGASGRNLAFAPAHMAATVLPGQPGTSVVAGHRDTHFAFLAQVRVGDEFTIERANGNRYLFRVQQTLIADTRVDQLPLDQSKTRLVLVTCYPFTDWQAGSPLRYLVVAERIFQEKVQNFEPVPLFSGKHYYNNNL